MLAVSIETLEQLEDLASLELDERQQAGVDPILLPDNVPDKLIDAQHRAVGKHDAALDNIAQFAHISGPGVTSRCRKEAGSMATTGRSLQRSGLTQRLWQ